MSVAAAAAAAAASQLKYDGAECVLMSSQELLAKVTDPDKMNPADVKPLGDTSVC